MSENLTGDQILNQVFDEENELLKTSAQSGGDAGGRTTIFLGSRGTEDTALYNVVLKDSPAPTFDDTGITTQKDPTNDLGYIIQLTTDQTCLLYTSPSPRDS